MSERKCFFLMMSTLIVMMCFQWSAPNLSNFLPIYKVLRIYACIYSLFLAMILSGILLMTSWDHSFFTFFSSLSFFSWFPFVGACIFDQKRSFLIYSQNLRTCCLLIKAWNILLSSAAPQSDCCDCIEYFDGRSKLDLQNGSQVILQNRNRDSRRGSDW